MSWINWIISISALLVSAVTLWLTILRRGSLKMTQPTVVFFGPDGGHSDDSLDRSKVFLRTLLYSTGRRGAVLESMHVRLSRGETHQNFNIWVHGDRALSRGSGMFVGPEGVACNHHFLLPRNADRFLLLPGRYTFRVFAKSVGDKEHRELSSIELTVTDTDAEKLKDLDAGIYFDWGPDAQEYSSHVEAKPKPVIPKFLLEPAEIGQHESSE